ncbi:MAG: neuraminidase [Cyclobacteriaceae bacterium]|nr:MAG: neuraminidase [Cyclobacteriaceae bacterium]
MNYRLLLIIITGLTYACGTSAHYRNIMIDSNSVGYGPCEPSIAIDPGNIDRLVVGAVLDRAYYSHDGGKSWSYQQLSSPYGVWGDPVVISDTKGNFYYFHLSFPSGKGEWDSDKLDRIVCQKSTDGGITWSDGVFTGLNPPKDQDKEWGVVDPENNNIYLTWTQFDVYASDNPDHRSNIMFSKSTDDGESWSPAISVNQFSGDCLDDDQTTEGAVPAVGPDGAVYVSWAYDERIYFDRSLDQGDSWMDQDVQVALQPGGWDQKIPGLGRANGMPVTLCDLSEGPYRGTIYVNWSDQSAGENDTDIWMASSSDNGMSWSDPVRVNNDQSARHQFFPWAAIDQTTGHLYVVFYDRRNHSDNTTEVYLATSTDGGKSFTNEKISMQSFRPNQDIFFGDYNNIAAHNGSVRPIWTQVDGTELSIWTAIVEK